MRTSRSRLLIALVAVLGLILATTSSGLAGQAASLSECPTGRVGLMVQWADAQVSVVCGTGLGQADAMRPEIVGLVVRWSNGSVGTIDLAATAQTAASETAVSESVVSESSSASTSSSTSMSCVNGQCTTTTTVCVDGRCSTQP
jgi:hypothetical protein